MTQVSPLPTDEAMTWTEFYTAVECEAVLAARDGRKLVWSYESPQEQTIVVVDEDGGGGGWAYVAG